MEVSPVTYSTLPDVNVEARLSRRIAHSRPGTLSIWCITDGKPGHEQQSQGLIEALARRVPVEVRWLPAPSIWRGGWDWLRGRFSPSGGLPSPQLIVAAGHQTHLAALAARRATAGRLVVLMRPSLPLRWFDLCLIPEHDFTTHADAAASPNIVTTRGVLNNMRPSNRADSRRGLMLIGGPSKHHEWDESAVVRQVLEVVNADPVIRWTLTTSRRTPGSVLQRLAGTKCRQLVMTSGEHTPPGWVADQLAEARTVFVTEDSVSMIYEALSAAANVGLFAVPRRRDSRVIRGIDRLIEQRAVIPFDAWRQDRFECREPIVLQEADRCADIVCERLLNAA